MQKTILCNPSQTDRLLTFKCEIKGCSIIYPTVCSHIHSFNETTLGASMHQILWSCVEEHCPHSRTLSRETYVLLSIGYNLQHNDGTFSKIPLGINVKKPVLWGRIQGRNNRSKEWESFSQAGNELPDTTLKPQKSTCQSQKHEGVMMNTL